MKLTNLKIEKLYGRFNYSVDVNIDENITIITAPNGFGKTAVITIINSLFNKRIEQLARFKFSSASFSFDDQTVINIVPKGTDTFDFIGDEPQSFDIETIRRGLKPERWPFSISEAANRSARSIERYLPFIQRVGTEYLDSTTNQFVSYLEIVKNYADELPSIFRKEFVDTPLFDEVISSVACHLIETQRLVKIDFDDRARVRSAPRTRSTVDDNAADLAQRIEAATKAYASAAQRLDQTFPQRVLDQLPANAPDAAELRESLKRLEEKRTDLSRFGLIEKSDSPLIGYQSSMSDEVVRNILQLYATDSEHKLSSFDALFRKIDLFASICNEHFTFKKLSISPDSGMFVRDDEGRPIPLHSLSSGEQHILVLNYDLLFRVSAGALILVDEPELSLHVAWQKRFISDLQKILTIQPMSVIVATHSPQIINDRWDLEIALESQA